MECVKCGRPLDEATGRCLYCDGQEEKVRVLTPEEKRSYDGVTIDTETGEQAQARSGGRPHGGGGRRIYIRKVDVSNSDWLTKLIVLAAVAAIAAFVLFVALPVALIGIGIAVLVWLILSFFRS